MYRIHSLLLIFMYCISIGDALDGQHWVLLVAGSNGYYNYRHQADVCHAYHIVRNHGVPEDNIVVMMYDDIAHSDDNPTPGVIINHPDGPNVYAGVTIDYTGKDVTPENFLNVLSGNRKAMNGTGSGKVIASTSQDKVFVNFVDHGAPGLLAFPSGELYAHDLMATLNAMYVNKQYSEMVMYIEACESGSMFEGILSNTISVYVTTAANGDESSYACYWDDARDTYLGDVYSVKWMEDSDWENLRWESIYDQFKIVKHEVNTSHVQEFGDKGISRESVGAFQGDRSDVPTRRLSPAPLNAVKSEMVPLATLHHQLVKARGPVQVALIQARIEGLKKLHASTVAVTRRIVTMAAQPHHVERLITSRALLTQHTCYKQAVQTYDTLCFDINQYDYALRQLYVLVNLCEELPLSTILEAIARVCLPTLS